MRKNALISECGTYRYWLTRVWDDKLRGLRFVMLNPSTADADIDDPTIRKCVGFAQRHGYGSIIVNNLFAFRATDPKELRKPHVDLVGPLNDQYLSGTRSEGIDTCLAWGAHARRFPARVSRVLNLLGGEQWFALSRLADGVPAHPLMLPYSCKLTEYSE